MTRRVQVVVPATSANLGPGFDALGLALRLHDRVEVETAADGVVVTVSGVGAGEVPTDRTHLVAATMLSTFAELGQPAPGLRLHCRNHIPQARGLGSSAAAIVAGVLAARALAGAPPDLAAELALAGRLEGHADNVAACRLGGATIAWPEPGAGFRAHRLEPAAGLRAYALIPPHTAATVQARALLPAQVSHGDAAFSAGRSALLVAALTADPALLSAGTADRLHQPYRAAAMPESLELVERLRDAGLAAVLSGAGPTVLVLAGPDGAGLDGAGLDGAGPTRAGSDPAGPTAPGAPAVAGPVLEQLARAVPAGWTGLWLEPDREGSRCVTEG